MSAAATTLALSHSSEHHRLQYGENTSVLFVCFLKVAEDLMEKLGMSKESLVTGAYMDLILKGHKEA